ncbi:MAG: hypothetical protein LBU84_13990 [Prevotella sp.]|nr:hypothetical protein [Prevotella sp.]
MYRDTKYNKITIATLKAGLLLVLILYLTSVNLFHHVHIVDGEVILHSHLYSGEKTSAHSHTSAELKMIQHLMTVEVSEFAPPTFSFTKFRNEVTILVLKFYSFEKKNILKDSFFLRPPPVL